FLAAQALGGLADPPADAALRLGRGLVTGLRLDGAAAVGLRLRLGVRVVLAADQFDHRDVSGVAAAMADPEQTGVATRPGRIARRDLVEQLRHHRLVGDIARDETPRVDAANGVARVGEAPLRDGDDALDERL